MSTTVNVAEMEDKKPSVNEGSRTVCREQYGQTAVKRDYMQTEKYQTLQQIDTSPKYTSIKQVFRTVFLPQGYPDSVSADYLEYQVWDTIQAFASSISGTLATHSLLHGMGVGDSSATVLAATLTWILKSGTGMTGQIVFAWIKGNQLDCDAKKWRLFADVLNDFAMCVEILAQLTPTYFRWVVCFAGVCKSLVGVAGGATRAALTQHQARRNNMADVSAKDGSQETLVNLMAMLCSFVLLPLVSDHYSLVCVLFAMLTGLHLFANYRAVRAVCMESLNKSRLHIIVDRYLRTGQVPGVAHVNRQEPLFGNPGGWTINLGASFSAVQARFDDLSRAFDNMSTKYLLGLDSKKKLITVVLTQDSDSDDQLQASIQGELLVFLLNNSLDDVWRGVRERMELGPLPDTDWSLVRQTYLATSKLFPHLVSALRAEGWRPNLCLLSADEWRAAWDFRAVPSSKKD